MSLRTIFALCLLIPIAGCAALPSVDEDALRARDTSDPQGRRSVFGREMEAHFRADLSRAVRVDEAMWDQRSSWEWLNEQKARLIEYYL